jgi:hypothetical protein
MNDIYDIVPFPDKIRTLFILESPHTDEIELGYPAAGETGKNMSRVILGNDSIALGKLLFDKDDLVSEYGIFNSCQFPLGIPEKLEGAELEVSGLKCVSQSKNRTDNYKRLKQLLATIENLDNKIRYKERFKQLINNSESIETLVFCGFISQAIFLEIYPNVKIPDYNKPTTLNSKKIHFVNHPSEIDSKWVYKK